MHASREVHMRVAIGGKAILLLVSPLATHAQATGETVLNCVSVDGARSHCAGYTDAGVALRRSVGTASCILGRNWGYDAEGVWVTEGCGGEFVLGNPAHEAQRVAAGGAAAPAADETAAVEQSLGTYKVYGRLGVQAAHTDGEAAVQDASSRIGLTYSIGDEIKMFVAAEWSVNLTGTPNPFNAGETTSSGFLILDPVQTNVFGNRLGYVGLEFGDGGRFTVGKQWSVYYDVTSYTDRFIVFGADASATFNAGTDGGFMGTGRADSALAYRNTFFDRVDVGLQMQLRPGTGGNGVDGYGASAQLHITDGLVAGVAYTRANFDDRFKTGLLGLNGDGEYATIGARYDAGPLSLAAVYARQRNGDVARVSYLDQGVPVVVPVAFDAQGVELYGRYELSRGFGLSGGYLEYRPELDPRNAAYIDPRARLRQYIAGLDYSWRPAARLFAEYRIADGVDAQGVPGMDAFVMGFQGWFSKSGAFTYP
jgi:predicted porin